MPTLDPADWHETRALGHRMLDEMFDYIEHIRGRPVWRPIPDEVRRRFRDALPTEPTALDAVYRDFTSLILPYSTGNVHPAFMGWVHGGGTVVGMLAEMLAAGLNANLGGRDHVPIEVERQVAEWARQMFGFPQGASGLFVTGTSMANFVSVLVARNWAHQSPNLTAYASVAAHRCIAKAMDMTGIGSAALRRIPADSFGRIRIPELRDAIAADRAAGFRPFLLVGTAGTVDIGAIDPLDELAGIAAEHDLWFHVDGAFGALAILAPDLAPRLKGIERSDSLAFDFHKWAQVPYDAGFVLVRDAQKQFDTFATSADYLCKHARGVAAGDPWPCDLGPDLSRGFRALKTWFTLKVYGTARLGGMISHTCEVARYLEHRIVDAPELELAAPVQLNIVCFRYRGANDELNADIVANLHESGIAVPSTTVIEGRLAIRAAIVNHRTEERDVDALLAGVLEFGRRASTLALHDTVLHSDQTTPDRNSCDGSGRNGGAGTRNRPRDCQTT